MKAPLILNYSNYSVPRCSCAGALEVEVISLCRVGAPEVKVGAKLLLRIRIVRSTYLTEQAPPNPGETNNKSQNYQGF